MALSLTTTTPYHSQPIPLHLVIANYRVDRINLAVDMEVYYYESPEAEQVKKQPLFTRNYRVNFSENPPPLPEKTEYMSQEMFDNMIKSMGIPTQPITPRLVANYTDASEMLYELLILHPDLKDAKTV